MNDSGCHIIGTPVFQNHVKEQPEKYQLSRFYVLRACWINVAFILWGICLPFSSSACAVSKWSETFVCAFKFSFCKQVGETAGLLQVRMRQNEVVWLSRLESVGILCYNRLLAYIVWSNVQTVSSICLHVCMCGCVGVRERERERASKRTRKEERRKMTLEWF